MWSDSRGEYHTRAIRHHKEIVHVNLSWSGALRIRVTTELCGNGSLGKVRRQRIYPLSRSNHGARRRNPPPARRRRPRGTDAGCKKVVREGGERGQDPRSQLRWALDQLAAGDVLMVTRLANGRSAEALASALA